MKAILAALLLLVSTSVALADWPLDKMNKQIEETNWILDNQCSGTTIDSLNRLILTNWHCVRGTSGRNNGPNFEPGDVFVSQRIYEDFSVIKEVTYAADVIFIDPVADVAFLRIRDKSVKLPSMASIEMTDTLVRGQKVYMVGNPQMQDNTLVVGYVSSPARLLAIEGTSRKYFQVSGGITGGASGGAAYNEDGKFIGITAAGSPQAIYIGFAVPISVIRPLLMTIYSSGILQRD